jgi:hypothetical protein
MKLFLLITVTIFIYHSLISTAESTSFVIQSMSRVNWNVLSQNYINKDCKYDSRGKCSGFCPLTLKFCTELLNYDQKVCGCAYCLFNRTTKTCNGQCGNLVLSNCINRVKNPSKNSDCVCSSCETKMVDVNIGDDYNVEIIKLPSCDSSMCHSRPCIPFFISPNKTTRNLECMCKND